MQLEDMDERDMRRILEENRMRRAPKDMYVGLEGRGRVWKVDGFHKGHNVYLDKTKMSQSVEIYNSEQAVFTLPKKVAHVNINGLDQCKVRVGGVITSVEVVHVQNVHLYIKGSCPVIQIDLSRDVTIHLSSAFPYPKIVNASNTNISVIVDGGVVQPLQTSYFGEQFVTAWRKGVMHTMRAESLKHGGYVSLAGVSGSSSDLLSLETSAASAQPSSRK